MTSTTTTRYENTRDENRERRDGESSGWRSWFGLGDQKDQDYGRDYKYSKTTTYRNAEPGYSTETSPSYGYKYSDRQFPEPATNYSYGYDKKEGTNYPTESYRSYSGDYYRGYPSRPSYGQEYPSRPYGPEPRPYGPEPRPYQPEPQYPSRPYGQEYPARPYGQEQYPSRPYNQEYQYPSRPYGQEEQYPSRPYGQEKYSYGSEYPSPSRYNYSGPQQYQSGYSRPYGNQSYYGRTSYSSNQ